MTRSQDSVIVYGGGILLLLAATGVSASLSVSGLQSWCGEPERTLGFIAFTMPLVVAAFCQLTAIKPGTCASS